jgi:hypothetical protein
MLCLESMCYVCYRYDPYDLLVRVGTSVRDEGGHIHEVGHIITHPNYDYDTSDCDIALLKVCMYSFMSIV